MRAWKLPSVFFALALICVMLPFMATRAGAEAYDIWVGGTQIDDTNLTTDDWEYEPSTGTLTLKGCTLTGELHASGAALVSQGIDLTVKGSGSLTGDGYGIRVFATPAGGGNLTLDVGELTAEGKGLAPESTDDSGIFADGSITILGGRLKAVGDDCGIYSKAGSITIKGGDVTAEAGEEIGDTAVRTDAGDITISGGTVKAEAGAGGIFAVGNVRIENGTKLVQAKAGTTAIRARDEAAAITIGDTLEIRRPAGGTIGKESGYDNIMNGTEIARDVLILRKDPTAVTYIVTVSDDGNGTGTADPVFGTKGTHVTLTDHAKEGYVLRAWEVVSGGVTLTGNSFDIGTADVEIKALFAKLVNVTYDLNGGIDMGTGNPYGVVGDHEPVGSDLNGSSFMTFGCWGAPEGKKLSGFEIEGAFVKYEVGFSYIFTHDVTVKFIWEDDGEPVFHTITYDMNGGIDKWTGLPYTDMVTGEALHGSDLNGTGFLVFGAWEPPAGMKLRGFEIEGAFIRNETGFSYIFTHDVTVKFIWEEVGVTVFHTVTYDLNGGIDKWTGLPYTHTVTGEALDGSDLNGNGFLVFGAWEPPAGKKLSGFEIEGAFIKNETGFSYIFTHDVTVKFIWKDAGIVHLPYEVYEWNLDGPGWKPVTAVFQSRNDPSELVVVKATVTSVFIPPNTIQYTAKATDPSGIVHTTTWTETVRDELSLDPHVPSRIPVPVVPVKPAGDLRPTAEPVIRIPGLEPAEPTVPAVTDEVPAAADETPAIVDEAPALPFADVADTDPYFAGIAYVWKSGIMNGVSENEFAPASTLTRAMLVTILGRLDGIDPADYAGSSFTDCGAVGTWDYAPYVEWAARNGIVLGYGDGTFGPMDPVTNEQAVLMLQRYAKYLGTEEDGELTFGIFPEGTVSPWAAEAVSWAFGNAVYARTDANPNEAACRGWMAQVICNFVGYLIK